MACLFVKDPVVEEAALLHWEMILDLEMYYRFQTYLSSIVFLVTVYYLYA